MTISLRSIRDFIYRSKFFYLYVGSIMIIMSLALIYTSQTTFNGVLSFKINSNYHKNIDKEIIAFFKINKIDDDFKYDQVSIYDVLSEPETFESLENYKNINFNTLPLLEVYEKTRGDFEYVNVSIKLENLKTEQIAFNELNALYKNVNNQIINKTEQNRSEYIDNILQNTEILIQELNIKINEYDLTKRIAILNLITMLENSAILAKTYDNEIYIKEKKRLLPFSPMITPPKMYTPSMLITDNLGIDSLSSYEEGQDVILEKLKLAKKLKIEDIKKNDINYINLMKLHEKATLDFNTLNNFFNDYKTTKTVNVKPYNKFNVDIYVTESKNLWFGELNINLLIAISILITLFVSPLLAILYKGVEINIED